MATAKKINVAKPAAPAKKPTATNADTPKSKPAARVTKAKAEAKPAAKKVAAVAKKPAPAPVAAEKRTYTMTPRWDKETRRAQLLKCAVAVLKRNKCAISSVTRAAVAREAGVTAGLIHPYFGNTEGLQVQTVQAAIAAGDVATAKKAIASGFSPKLLTRKEQQAVK